MPEVAARSRVAQQFEDLLQVADVGEAFFLMGRSYDTLVRALRRAGRQDLAGRLSQWHSEDTKRLRHARGVSRW